MNQDCIFCKIVAGEIPSAKVYEDEHVCAFLDISQTTKGHTLIIPKQHTRNVYDLKEDVAEKLFARVPKVANAIKDAFQPVGMNILNNNEEAAGQTVFHLHIHLIPRYGKADGFGAKWETHTNDYTNEDLQAMAHSISEQIQM
ncbi:HIT family protein [Pontibacillus litoralis]|uniref:Protein hit n=1 Tax=Pontibacillus litoralis JSM 072002 TaxID=1385512 RepID=A0A0A5FZP3_9BACI|nr:HIT family protein [Pontibacillus litoralis]KGX85264.1 protein hit [Pontibacillus litoralis JSM 072002]